MYGNLRYFTGTNGHLCPFAARYVMVLPAIDTWWYTHAHKPQWNWYIPYLFFWHYDGTLSASVTREYVLISTYWCCLSLSHKVYSVLLWICIRLHTCRVGSRTAKIEEAKILRLWLNTVNTLSLSLSVSVYFFSLAIFLHSGPGQGHYPMAICPTSIQGTGLTVVESQQDSDKNVSSVTRAQNNNKWCFICPGIRMR